MYENRKPKGAEQPEFRKCCACGELKNTKNDFYWSNDVDGASYPSGRCKPCCAKRLIEYRKTRKSKYAEYARLAREKNPEPFKASQRKYNKTEKSRQRVKRYICKKQAEPSCPVECVSCKEIKDSKTGYYRFEQPCKKCRNIAGRERAKANPDAVKARRKRYYAENRELHIRKAKEWQTNNRERHNEWNRRNAKTEAGRARQRQANWNRRAKVYRAKVDGAPPITHDWFLQLCAEHNHRCFYCWGQGMKLSADHVVAIANGGKHVRENIVPSCKSCNSRKSDIEATKFCPAISIAAYGLELASA